MLRLLGCQMLLSIPCTRAHPHKGHEQQEGLLGEVLARGQGWRPCPSFSGAHQLCEVPAPGGSSSVVHVSLGRGWMLNRCLLAFVIAQPSFPSIFLVFVLSSQ